MELEQLYRVADEIPSMGGREIGPILREYTKAAPAGTAVVEVGCWLGAGTAQLALGIRERTTGSPLSIYCYDRWTANEPEVAKAALQGLSLEVGEDILPHTRRMLAPFGVPIQFLKGDLRKACWTAGPISVYVDDASKTPKLFLHSLGTFGPSWIPGETVIFLMDFDIWTKTGNAEHRCQKEFIEAHPQSFERIPYPDVAVFRYSHPVNFTAWIMGRFEKEAKQLAKVIEQKEAALRRIKGSLSWRITSPLRRGRSAFMKATRRG